MVNDLYKLVKNRLLELDMKFEDLCEELDLSESGVRKMLNRGTLKVETAQKISKLLDVPVQMLLKIEKSSAVENANDRVICHNNVCTKCAALLKTIDKLNNYIEYLENEINNRR